MKDFGKILKGARQSRGLSVYTLGEAAGVSHSTIGNLETGHADVPMLDTFERICLALEVDPRIFLDDAFQETKGNLALGHLTQEQIDFVINPENLVYLLVGYEAKARGIDPKGAIAVINSIADLRPSKNG